MESRTRANKGHNFKKTKELGPRCGLNGADIYLGMRGRVKLLPRERERKKTERETNGEKNKTINYPPIRTIEGLGA